jgi:aryl-alcohol dehydrogenase-like predicted oxidoreductase
MRKVDRVRFLVQEDTRTMAQSAIQFVLKQKAIVSVLPNFTNLSELKEYTSALDTPEITDEEQSKLDELWEHDFDLAEPERQFREV